MSLNALYGQLLVGLINGSFYALLSLGLAIIFGLLGIVNIAQGALYMAGAFFAWMLLRWLGVGYWPALVLSPSPWPRSGSRSSAPWCSASTAPITWPDCCSRSA